MKLEPIINVRETEGAIKNEQSRQTERRQIKQNKNTTQKTKKDE